MESGSRIDTLERRADELAARLDSLEWRLGVRAGSGPAARTDGGAEREAAAPGTPSTPAPAPSPRPAAEPAVRSLEDLVGGRVLAWAGAGALLLGVVLLFAIAITHGWIGETARVVLAAAGSLALGAADVWLHERRGRTDAALAAVSAAIAALFLTVAVAAQAYALVPPLAGVALAMVVGAAGTALAIRWNAQGIGALGIVGGLLAPVLAGASSSGGSLALLWVAACSATAVLLHQRWRWLAWAVFVLSTVQVAAWATGAPSEGGVLAVLVAFGAVDIAAAAGRELRVRAAEPEPDTARLLVLVAIALAAGGEAALAGIGQRDVGTVWVAGVALACFGAARIASARAPGWRGLLDGLGVAALAYVTELALGGSPLPAVWAAEALALGLLARRGADRVAAAGAAALTGLAAGHALLFEAPPGALVTGPADLGTAAVGLGAVALAALGCALGAAGGSDRRIAAVAAAGVALLYLASIALVAAFQPGGGAATTAVLDLGIRQQGQVLLSALWACAGAAALVAGLRTGLRPLRIGALTLLLVALGKVAIYDLSTLTAGYRVGSCLVLGLVLLLGAYAWQRARPAPGATPRR